MKPIRPRKSGKRVSQTLFRASLESASLSAYSNVNRLALAIVLLLLALTTTFLRIFWRYSNVFAVGAVRFQGNDPWVHVRQVDYLVRHFPYRLEFDPFGVFPGGQRVPLAPLLDYLTAGIALLIHAVCPERVAGLTTITNLCCAFTPPVVAALTTLTVYFLGRSLGNRAVGLLAALLITVAPGIYYGDSVLGFFDHHVLEVLLSTLVFLALLVSFNSAKIVAPEQNGVQRARALRRGLLRSCVFGLVLALYLLTWIGGSFVVLIVAAWTIALAVVEHVTGRDLRVIRLALAPGLALATLIILPFLNAYPLAPHQCASLIVTIALAIGLPAVSSAMRRRGWSRMCFVAFVGVSTMAVGVGLYLLRPDLFDRVLAGFFARSSDSTANTIGEVRSLYWFNGRGTARPAWMIFATGFPLAMVGFVVVARRAWHRGHAADVLLLVWSGAVFVAMLGQIRFGYYAAVNVALLSAIACIAAIEHAQIIPGWLLRGGAGGGDPDDSADSANHSKRTTRREAHERGDGQPPRWQGLMLLAWLLGIAVVPPAYALSRVVDRYTGPSDAWMQTLEWMRHETPEPFGDPAAYFDVPREPHASKPFVYPATAYGVMCWWDYGYWVTGVARRIPCANPTQRGAAEAGRFFTATQQADALKVLREQGARYVLVDRTLPMLPVERSGSISGKFGAMSLWAKVGTAKFYETFTRIDSTGTPQPITLYYPAYFQTMCVRLYLFGGARVTPTGPFQVVFFTEVTDRAGVRHKRIDDIQTFNNYETAAELVARSNGAGVALVSDDPTRSCVPLKPLEHIRLVFDSLSSGSVNGKDVGDVRVFEVDAAALVHRSDGTD